MTKIDQINETIAIQSTKKPNESATVPFSTSLENAMSNQIHKKSGGGQTSPLSEPQSPVINRPGVPATSVVGQTEKLLALLESYAAGLENPGATLKELSSMVTEMKDEAMQLMASTGTNSTGENDLNGIAAKAALTANVEYIKFNRGDYI